MEPITADSRKYVKLLLTGPSGTGKTVGAVSFPGPFRYFDFDGKLSSAINHYGQESEKIKSILRRNYSELSIRPNKELNKLSRMQIFNADLFAIQKIQHQPLPFKTLVIDSLTMLSYSLLEDYKYVSQTGIKRKHPDVSSQEDYGLHLTHMMQIITGLLSLDCNVVMIGHTYPEKDELSGAITNSIDMAGKLASKLPMVFQEVYYTKISGGKYIWQTASDGKSICRTERKLPAEIPASYNAIIGVP